MDIFISGNLPKNSSDTGKTIRLQLPALPEEITFSGAARIVEYSILELGEIARPDGSEISEFSWEAMLPGSGRKNEPWIRGKWIDPKTIQTYFSVWKKYGVKLKLLITGTPINHYVYLQDYEVKYSGGYGDYQYSINFVNAEDITVSVTKKKKATTTTKKTSKAKTTTNRATKTKSKTYTIKKGDTLWAIAVKYYKKGSQYTKIYNANKTVLDKAAKKYGFKNSNKGNRIWPGTKITIP